MIEPLRVVSIGGGTGLSALLNGLKKYTRPAGDQPWVDITAVVTVTDEAEVPASAPRFRRAAPGYPQLPGGPLRRRGAVSNLFQYRFAAGQGLKGHSFGNLFLTALTNDRGFSGSRQGLV